MGESCGDVAERPSLDNVVATHRITDVDQWGALMPVPFPTDVTERVGPPDLDEVLAVAGAFTSALSGPDGLTELQMLVMHAMTKSLTGFDVKYNTVCSTSPQELGVALADRSAMFRRRIVQLMLIGELLMRPLPREVSERVEQYALELGVCDDMFAIARRLSEGSLGLALVDFQRSGYQGNWDFDEYADSLHTRKRLAEAWEENPNDPDLAARWAALEHCRPNTLGRKVFDFYQARGFVWPGLPHSAPPLLAQHDWLHVLADYGSTVECEVEVFTFIARANDDPQAFSLQAMVLNLFETGYLIAGAGLFEYDMGHLSRTTDHAEHMAVRMADAMYRGAKCSFKADLLKVDWFAFADRPVDDVRREFNIIPKSEDAYNAGSVSPWELGGISPFQFECGQQRAADEGATVRVLWRGARSVLRPSERR